VDADGDGWPEGQDCDDGDPTVHPGATEICDGLDNDCNGHLPNHEQDGDGDGVRICDGDCNDGNAAIHPGATEVCDGLDNDCSGAPEPDEVDQDGDAVLVCDGDCDDTDPGVFPGAAEACDGLDNDCDGAPDAGEVDGDGDGAMVCDGDCDDADPDAYPGAAEQCDGVDNDCDGALPFHETDGDGDGWMICDGDCDDADPGAYPGAAEQCDGVDNDCDGAVPADEVDADADDWMVCDGDCDDADPGVYPGAVEACDGVDTDCDGALPVDEEDDDGDGWRICDGDCDDGDASVNPGAAEACNGIDDDCDGAVPADETDSDGDGFRLCDGDCDDLDPQIHPGAAEACDGLDNDCDGSPGANELDDDGDGVMVCDGDCDDGDAAVLGWIADDSGFMRSDCNPVITYGTGGLWDDYTITPGPVIWDGTQYLMHYSGYDGSRWRVGVATSADLLSWEKYAGNPVLDLGGSGEWDDAGVFWTDVLYDGSSYHLFYSGYSGSTYRIGHATSADGLAWTKDPANPVLDLGASGEWDDYHVYAPTVAEYDGEYHLWYVGAPSSGGDRRIGHATSADLSTWTRDPDNYYLSPDLTSEGSYLLRPTVREAGGQLYMMLYYNSGTSARQRMLTTLDGVNWMRTTSTVSFDRGVSGAWDDSRTLAGVIHPEDGGVYLYYRGASSNTGQSNSIGVAYNRMPTATLDAPADGATFTQGDLVEFEATVTDHAFVENVEVYLESDLQGMIGQTTPSAAGEVSIGTANLAPGVHTLTLTVIDEGGLEATDQIAVQVDAWDCLADPSGPPDWDADGYTVCEGDCDDLDSGVGGWDRTTSGWMRSPCNPIVEPTPSGSFADQRIYLDQVTRDGDLFRSWFSAYDGSDWRLGAARSPDGLAWRLEHEGAVVRYWPWVAMDHGESGEWDDDGLWSTSAVDDGTGSLRVFHAGYDGSHWRIGLAESWDGTALERNPASPVLDLGQSGTFDDYHVYDPTVLYDGASYHMWYGGRPSSSGTIRIGYAGSTDAVTWTRVDTSAVVDVTGGDWDDTHVFGPSVVAVDSGYLMAYQGHTGSQYKLGLAFSSDGVNWTKSSLNPLPMGASGEWDDYHNRTPALYWDGVDLTLWYAGCPSSGCSEYDVGVMRNRWPTAAITAPGDGDSFPSGTAITFTAAAEDYAALDTLAVTWTDTWGNVLDTGSPDVFGDISFTTSSLSIGTHYIGLTVTDEGGLYANDVIEVTVY